MHKRIILPLLLAALTSLLVTSRQGLASAALQDRKIAVSASQQSNAAKRDGIEFHIKPIMYSDQTSDFVETDHYKVGDLIRAELWMTNMTNEEITEGFGDRYVHFRPSLLKDGKPVQFLKEIRQTIQETEERYRAIGGTSFLLNPNTPQRIGYFNLKDWYGPLEPGHYEFTLRFRFYSHRKPVESNTVTFDVVP